MNHTVSSRTARLHRVFLFLTRKLTQWQRVETVVHTQGVRFVYLGDEHLRIQLYPFGPTCPTLVICPTLLYKKNPAYRRHQLSRPMRIEGPIQI